MNLSLTRVYESFVGKKSNSGGSKSTRYRLDKSKPSIAIEWGVDLYPDKSGIYHLPDGLNIKLDSNDIRPSEEQIRKYVSELRESGVTEVSVLSKDVYFNPDKYTNYFIALTVTGRGDDSLSSSESHQISGSKQICVDHGLDCRLAPLEELDLDKVYRLVYNRRLFDGAKFLVNVSNVITEYGRNLFTLFDALRENGISVVYTPNISEHYDHAFEKILMSILEGKRDPNKEIVPGSEEYESLMNFEDSLIPNE